MKMDEDYQEMKCIMLDHNYDKDGMCPACTFFKDCRKKKHIILESNGIHLCARDFLKSMTAFDTKEGKEGSIITINRIENYDEFTVVMEDDLTKNYNITGNTLSEHELSTFEFNLDNQKLKIELKAKKKYIS